MQQAKQQIDVSIKESQTSLERRLKNLESEIKELSCDHKNTKKIIDTFTKEVEQKIEAAKEEKKNAKNTNTGGNYDHREKKRINESFSQVHTSLEEIRKD